MLNTVLHTRHLLSPDQYTWELDSSMRGGTVRHLRIGFLLKGLTRYGLLKQKKKRPMKGEFLKDFGKTGNGDRYEIAEYT